MVKAMLKWEEKKKATVKNVNKETKTRAERRRGRERERKRERERERERERDNDLYKEKGNGKRMRVEEKRILFILIQYFQAVVCTLSFPSQIESSKAGVMKCRIRVSTLQND